MADGLGLLVAPAGKAQAQPALLTGNRKKPRIQPTQAFRVRMT